MGEPEKGTSTVDENNKKNTSTKVLTILFVIIVLGLAYDVLFIK